MNNIEIILQNEIRDALMKRPISFVVMNKNTHDKLVKIHNTISTCRMDKITRCYGLDILVSEDINDNEFKIG